MKRKLLLILVLVLFANLVISQETVGLVFDDVNAVKADGYTLIKPTSDDRTFLINNCGEVVNQWSFITQNSRNSYLLENGNLMQSSGLGAELRDWDNNLLWSINYQDKFGFRIHHDIEPLPNGNFLVLVRDVYTNTEMFAVGLDSSFPEETLQLERILEIEPIGTDDASIVWEWKLFDHLIQDFDVTKPNYGIVSDNPQLLNVNYNDGDGSNPIHANAMDYNEDLDQIAFSARNLKEVFIIDHSTTTLEAASSSGGLYGKGGDFLWRWGNPEVYNQGTFADRKLGRQHDIKWITEGPFEGKMSVFSNEGYGNNISASSVHIIDQNGNNGVYTLDSGKFLPDDYLWSWDDTIMGIVMNSATRSGFQTLANGNGLINESFKGRITEIDNSGNVIWVYIIPVSANTNFDQFSEPTNNSAFRAHRYSENYEGFNGVTFNNTGIIEDVNSISENCINLLSVDDVNFNSLSIYPNPTSGVITINYSNPIDEILVIDVTGKVVLSQKHTNTINLEELSKGLYIIKVSSGEFTEFKKVLKQ
jgi:hypothetical protein